MKINKSCSKVTSIIKSLMLLFFCSAISCFADLTVINSSGGRLAVQYENEPVQYLEYEEYLTVPETGLLKVALVDGGYDQYGTVWQYPTMQEISIEAGAAYFFFFGAGFGEWDDASLNLLSFWIP